jgi:hypothetical protein
MGETVRFDLIISQPVWIAAFGDEGAELRFSPVFSPAMSEGSAAPAARMA